MDRAFRLPVTSTFGEMDAAGKRMQIESCAGFDRYPSETTLSPAYFEAFMADAVAAAERKNVPLYCGEYGVIDRVGGEDTLKWFRCIHSVLERHNIGRCAWTYKELDFGLTDTRLDDVRSDVLQCL